MQVALRVGRSGCRKAVRGVRSLINKPSFDVAASSVSVRWYSSESTVSSLEDVITYCRRRAFVYGGSDIYGGMANSFDYGPLGVLLKRNVQRLWWNKFVRKRRDTIGIDSSIIMSPKVWEATGHVENFTDPLAQCGKCRTRWRADTDEEARICPACKSTHIKGVRHFNLLFKTSVGSTMETSSDAYLRPETAQGVYVNFQQLQKTTRMSLPFGVGQIGKSFRNEINPGHFLFRTREFEQMELQYFCRETEAQQWFKFWVEYCRDFLIEYGMKEENIQLYEYASNDLAHYAAACTDILFKYPFGWAELWGIANRTDYDLRRHSEASRENLQFIVAHSGETFFPHAIEPAVGVDRLILAFLVNSLETETLENGQERLCLKLHEELAPYSFAVFPVVKKNKAFVDMSNDVYERLSTDASVDYDEKSTIGKRYRRHDEIGTPFCVTIDQEGVDTGTVTVRERDSMKQIRLSVEELTQYTSRLSALKKLFQQQ